MWKSVHRELQETVKVWLWRWSICLYGRSVRGTWKGTSFIDDPEGYVENGLETGNSLHLGTGGEPGRELIYRGR